MTTLLYPGREFFLRETPVSKTTNLSQSTGEIDKPPSGGDGSSVSEGGLIVDSFECGTTLGFNAEKCKKGNPVIAQDVGPPPPPPTGVGPVTTPAASVPVTTGVRSVQAAGA